jgi:hypothetical protein
MKAAFQIIGAVESSEVTVIEQIADEVPGEPMVILVSMATEEVIVLTAEMIDGMIITEEVVGFDAFVEMAISFKRDPDVIGLTW